MFDKMKKMLNCQKVKVYVFKIIKKKFFPSFHFMFSYCVNEFFFYNMKYVMLFFFILRSSCSPRRLSENKNCRWRFVGSFIEELLGFWI